MPTINPKDQETFEALVKTVQRFYPKYSVVPKAESKLHRFIGWVLKTFTPNDRYMTDFWTYFNNTNAYPIEDYHGQHYRNYRVNAHEGTHAAQEKRWSTFLWGSLYLLGTPVYAVLFALFSLPLYFVGGLVETVPWWAGLPVFGAGLVLSSPIPFGWWRSEWELQAYGVTIATLYWCHGQVPDSTIEYYASKLSDGTYFYAWLFKKRLRKRLYKARELAEQGKFLAKWEPKYKHFFAAIYKTLKDQGRIR